MPFSVSGEYLRLTDPGTEGTRTTKGLVESYAVMKRRIITYGALDIARQLRAS